jgi:predicted aldo/keto reductase-like oxidoreductase
MKLKEAEMNRRRFMKDASSSLALLGSFPATLASLERAKGAEGLERRSLGRTGEKLSILGFGGIVVMNATPEEASKRVGEAIEGGVNYFDVAPSYGNAEDRLGPALEPYRKNVFLACKTTEREKVGATKELESSLKKMRTDHFDLYQLHAMTKLEEVDRVFSSGGAMETFLEARKSGKVRFLGFSAHSVEAGLALMDRFDFDTILFPVNFATWHAGNFGPQVLARAQQKKMGILALKAMAKGPWAKDATKTFSKCWYEPLSSSSEAMKGLRFTLSHPITAAVPPGDETLFKMALSLARAFTPLPPEEAEAIKAWALKGNPIFKYPMERLG